MTLDQETYREILSRMNERSVSFAPPSDLLQRWLQNQKVPSQLADFLTNNSVTSLIPFANGCGGVSPFEEIIDGDEFALALLDAGLFPIASAINGDYIVVDFRDPDFSAGFVSHDELWEEEVEEAREAYIRVADSINEMLAGISESIWTSVHNEAPANPFPIDYDGAKYR